MSTDGVLLPWLTQDCCVQGACDLCTGGLRRHAELPEIMCSLPSVFWQIAGLELHGFCFDKVTGPAFTGIFISVFFCVSVLTETMHCEVASADEQATGDDGLYSKLQY